MPQPKTNNKRRLAKLERKYPGMYDMLGKMRDTYIAALYDVTVPAVLYHRHKHNIPVADITAEENYDYFFEVLEKKYPGFTEKATSCTDAEIAEAYGIDEKSAARLVDIISRNEAVSSLGLPEELLSPDEPTDEQDIVRGMLTGPAHCPSCPEGPMQIIWDKKMVHYIMACDGCDHVIRGLEEPMLFKDAPWSAYAASILQTFAA